MSRRIRDSTESLTCVSMGNPHVVFYCQKVADVGPLEPWARCSRTPRDVPAADQRPFRRRCIRPSEVTHANLGTRQRHHAGLRHRGMRGMRGRRADRADRTGGLSAHLPGGDLELEWREVRQLRLQDGPGDRGLFSGEWPE